MHCYLPASKWLVIQIASTMTAHFIKNAPHTPHHHIYTLHKFNLAKSKFEFLHTVRVKSLLLNTRSCNDFWSSATFVGILCSRHIHALPLTTSEASPSQLHLVVVPKIQRRDHAHSSSSASNHSCNRLSPCSRRQGIEKMSVRSIRQWQHLSKVPTGDVPRIGANDRKEMYPMPK